MKHWLTQLRATEAELQLEIELYECEKRHLEILQSFRDSLIQELDQLLSELDGVIDWLRRRIEEKAKEEFPPPKADVVPATSRVSELELSLRAEWERLPQSSELLNFFSPLPKRRTKLRGLQPQETIQRAFERSARPEILQVFEEVEAEHRKIVQEIERAREVVAFGLETASFDKDSGPQVIEESLQNAFSLLDFYRGERPDWRATAEIRMAKALAALFVEARIVLSRDRLGAFTYVARQGFRRAFLVGIRVAFSATGRGLQGLYKAGKKLAVGSLVAIGWIAAPAKGRVEVTERTFFPNSSRRISPGKICRPCIAASSDSNR